ncbi:MAG TPA: hypothetical protein VFL79_18905 [Terriglobia bacterium]|nr:hypothetical protein [Terriglobia bacterium]
MAKSLRGVLGGLDPARVPGHLLVFNEASLRRALNCYFRYYGRSRTHLSLAKDAPEARAAQPAELGPVVELTEVGGLHHCYERRAA